LLSPFALFLTLLAFDIRIYTKGPYYSNYRISNENVPLKPDLDAVSILSLSYKVM